MKFTRYLASHRRPEWEPHYVLWVHWAGGMHCCLDRFPIRYADLKKLLQEIPHAPHPVNIPTQLSLSAGFGQSSRSFTCLPSNYTAQETFFLALEKEVARINDFSQEVASEMRAQLAELLAKIPKADLSVSTERQALLSVAKAIGDEYLQLEKYCNLNYAGLQKILKKHDKLLPEAPCYHFYKAHIANQPWVQGDHQDTQTTLRQVFTELHRSQGRGDASATRHGNEEYIRKFWVRPQDLSQVRHLILQHLPAIDKGADNFEANQMIVNTLFLDSANLELYHNMLYGRPYSSQIQLRWRGVGPPKGVRVQRDLYKEGWRPEAAVKESFPLPENKVAEFILGRLTFAHAHKFIQKQQERLTPSRKVPDAEAIALEYKLYKNFTEIQHMVESKDMQPMVRVVHRQELFEAMSREGGAPSIKVELQVDIEALLEYSFDGMNRLANGMWYQEHPADRIEFPYIVLKIKTPMTAKLPGLIPPWMKPLIDDGLVTEVHDFCRMQFAMCGLLPDMVRAVPVWIDDHELQRALYLNIIQRDENDPDDKDGADYGDIDVGSREDDPSAAEDNGSAGLRSSFQQEKRGLGSAKEKSKWRTRAEKMSMQADSSGCGSEDDRRRLLAMASENIRTGTAGWQAKLLQRQGGKGRVYNVDEMMRAEPVKYMQNERIFLKWMSLAITMAGLSVSMLGFASTAHTDPKERPIVHISEVTALALMACAIYVCAYGITIYNWRAPRLTDVKTKSVRYDDTLGLFYLTLIIVLAYTALLAANIVDMLETMKGDKAG